MQTALSRNPSRPGPGYVLVPVLYAMTLFVSSTLLFTLQPLFARLVLPLLGGSPAVWNTCMVFYQAALLAGYAYAHASTSWLGVRRQALLHLVLLPLPLLVLPIALPAGWLPPCDTSPLPWLLALLAVTVLLPFTVVSTTAPLLQRWFASTGHPDSGDPYFLYSASNAGSLLALLAYPLLLEPNLTRSEQALLWALGYGVLLLLVGACWAVGIRGKGPRRTETQEPQGHPGRCPGLSCCAPSGQREAGLRPEAAQQDSPGHRPGCCGHRPGARPAPSAPPPARFPWSTIRSWLLLSLVPAALLPAVTAHITTDVAAIPLLWVLPLGLYLLSFILVYVRFAASLHFWAVRLMPLLVLVLVYLMVLRLRAPLLVEIELHLAVFFLIALVCHGELARQRPGPRHLTAYFLWMSAGGVVGGLLVVLLAPLVFTRTLEYPLGLTVACLVCPGKSARAGRASQWRGVHGLETGWEARPALADFLAPVSLGLLTGIIAWALRVNQLEMDVLGRENEDLLAWVLWLWAVGLPVGICFALIGRPVRFGLAVGAVLLAAGIAADLRDHVERRERSFYGQLCVQQDSTGEYRWLLHGTTLHGWQSLDPARRDEPLTYFHRTGPVGQLFALRNQVSPPRTVGVAGLGIGSMASYARAGQAWTFWEIDPAVVRLADNPRFFTYLADCRARGVDLHLVLGDARLQIQEAPDHSFDLLFLDAFSSDSVPIHLITFDALKLYLEKLKPGGWLVYNVSNRYLDLEPVLANQAEQAGLTGWVQYDTDVEGEDKRGKTRSTFVVLARPSAGLDLARDSRWRTLRPRPEIGTWTDEFSNLLGVFRR